MNLLLQTTTTVFRFPNEHKTVIAHDMAASARRQSTDVDFTLVAGGSNVTYSIERAKPSPLNMWSVSYDWKEDVDEDGSL